MTGFFCAPAAWAGQKDILSNGEKHPEGYHPAPRNSSHTATAPDPI